MPPSTPPPRSRALHPPNGPAWGQKGTGPWTPWTLPTSGQPRPGGGGIPPGASPPSLAPSWEEGISALEPAQLDPVQVGYWGQV